MSVYLQLFIVVVTVVNFEVSQCFRTVNSFLNAELFLSRCFVISCYVTLVFSQLYSFVLLMIYCH